MSDVQAIGEVVPVSSILDIQMDVVKQKREQYQESLLTLMDFSNAHMPHGIIPSIKEIGVFDRELNPILRKLRKDRESLYESVSLYNQLYKDISEGRISINETGEE